MQKYLLLLVLLFVSEALTASPTDNINYNEVQSVTAPPTYVKPEPISNWLNFHIFCPSSVSLFSGRKDIKFLLYNKNYPRGVDISQDLGEGKLTPNTPLKFLIHGFLNSANTAMVQTVKNAYMARTEDYNVIGVDWTKGSGTWMLNYYTCLITSRIVPLVGKGTAEFISDLVDKQNVNLMHIHVIGHSLGGQIAGFTGKHLIEMGHKLPVIVALDPAQPSFKYNNESERLAPTDAEYVEVIHTNCDNMGFLKPLGTADFYPNYSPGNVGRMPGCSADKFCSHAKSFEYFSESIMNPYAFEAVKCSSFAALEKGRCSSEGEGDVKAYMGGNELRQGKFPGIFYLKTNKNPPYGQATLY